jgi:hypothetical protein
MASKVRCKWMPLTRTSARFVTIIQYSLDNRHICVSISLNPHLRSKTPYHSTAQPAYRDQHTSPQFTPDSQVHPPPTASHSTITERQCLDKDDRWPSLEPQQSPQEVLHILHMLHEPLVIDRELDEHEVGIERYMQREAE